MDKAAEPLPQETKTVGIVNNQIRFLRISCLILLIVTLLLASFEAVKYLPKKEAAPVQPGEANLQEEAAKGKLYFSKQHLDQPISQYDHALLASPDVLNEQKDGPWQAMECLSSDEPKSEYNFAEISEDIKEEKLIAGLQEIENYKYKVMIKNEKGSITREYTSLQKIGYTQICKDSENYYVLFLTEGDRSASSLLVKEAKAAGGWWGQSNFAVIPFTGKMVIHEDVNDLSKNIPISDLSERGFSSPTARTFAYYACTDFIGKLGENLYVVCGGEGGNGLFKIQLKPVSFKEISFCWSLTPESPRVCYDSKAKIYYQYQY
ncbi:MAG TPA: hypothetical protein VMW04_01965 [Patescibacteria group bacterium]|nr:hypothetical protein [Patescibacteria group bacterium]